MSEAATTDIGAGPSADVLREVVFALAAIERAPGSAGEREAAEWIAERLRAAGVEDVALEDEPTWGPFPPFVTKIALAGVLGGMLTLSGRRFSGGLLSALSGLALADEIQNGPRPFRKALRKRLQTVNVVGRAGDGAATHDLVLLAHHDAAQTGFMFDQTAAKSFHARFPSVIPRIKTQPPQWWGAIAGPALGVAAALDGSRRKAGSSAFVGLATAAIIGDMWRSQVVPGANDNLSAVACLVATAEALRESPLPGLRVWLVSAGAEETFQDGIRAFAERHGPELDPATTSFLCLDTIGSPRLVLLEGEGPLWMEDYDDRLRSLVWRAALRRGLRLERGFRARASTDAVIPMRHGYATANLASVNDYHHLSNYHLPSDTAENLNYDTVAEAARVVWALAEELSAAQTAAG